jgi:hypothetical protein
MPYKDKIKQKESQHESFLRNKRAILDRSNARKRKCKNFLLRVKRLKSSRCFVCGEDRWQCLDFHHLDRTTKIDGLADMARKGVSIRNLKLEIRKCKIVCANCHRIIHNGHLWN